MADSSNVITGVLNADSRGRVARNSVFVRPFAAAGSALSSSDSRSASRLSNARRSSVDSLRVVISKTCSELVGCIQCNDDCIFGVFCLTLVRASRQYLNRRTAVHETTTDTGRGVACLGEALVLVSPPPDAERHLAGAEANVAAGLVAW